MEETPNQAPCGDSGRARRWHRLEISIVEVFLIVAILSAWFAFLVPAANQARDRDGHAPILDGFTPFAANNGWSVTGQLLFIPAFAAVIGGIAAAFLAIVRILLPPKARQRIVWLPTTGPLSFATKRDLLRVTVIVAFLIAVLFLSIIFMPR